MKHTITQATAKLAACAFLLVAATPSGALAQANSKADQVRALNGQVLRLQADLRGGQAAAARSRAAEVLAARAAALRELIAADPTQAAALAFPASVLEQLAADFPAEAGRLEQHGRWVGELEHLIEDDVSMKSHRAIYKVHGQGYTIGVHFAGREPGDLRSGRQVGVGGVRVGTDVAVSELELMDAAQGGDAQAGAQTYPATCAPAGAQSVVSLLVNLPGYKLPAAVSPDHLRGVLLGNAYSPVQSTPDWSIDDFWQQASDGGTYLDPANTTVVGPVELASNYNTDASGASYCDYYGLRDAVMKAVDSTVDFKRYSRIQIVLPPNGACGWAGVANVGCRTLSTTGDGTFSASVAWQRADQMTSRSMGVMLGTHELGHTLGLSHASSRDFGAEALGAVGSAGSLTEYGDVHSTMGSWNLGFYAASHAANQLGWLRSGAQYQVAESSGTYTIQNYEGRPAGIKALKVRRGTGNDAWLWIESRQNTGAYSPQLSASLFTGALIHYEDASTGGKSHLLDFTPATSSFSDSALPVGQTWTDPYSNVSVTVNSVTAGAMTVTVNYGSLPCTTAAPTVTASPTSVATETGASTSFAVTVKNNSSSGCAAEAFAMSAVAPAGWSQSFASSSLTVNPGQQSQTTLTVAVPAASALGTFAVTGSAASATTGKGGSSSANVTVTAAANTLSVALSGTGSVQLSSPARTCTSACTQDYVGAASGTSVTLTPVATDSRFVFSGWSGACSGTGACIVTMSLDRSVTATFKRASGGKPRR